MKPIVKYQGGKGRELKLIKELVSFDFVRVVEPFAGGAAVSFSYEKPCVLSDVNDNVVNLYQVVSCPNNYALLKSKVNAAKVLDRDDLSEIYYASRDYINSDDKADKVAWAFHYIILRQLCFSGMERYNKSGEFNVPFGHYKKLSCNLSDDHQKLLSTASISLQSFEHTIRSCSDDDFLFLDPPYLDRLGYTQGDGGLGLHSNLYEELKDVGCKFLLIHSDNEFYRDIYRDFNIFTKDFIYSQRFGKGKNHTSSAVQHLYITNF